MVSGKRKKLLARLFVYWHVRCRADPTPGEVLIWPSGTMLPVIINSYARRRPRYQTLYPSWGSLPSRASRRRVDDTGFSTRLRPSLALPNQRTQGSSVRCHDRWSSQTSFWSTHLLQRCRLALDEADLQATYKLIGSNLQFSEFAPAT